MLLQSKKSFLACRKQNKETMDFNINCFVIIDTIIKVKQMIEYTSFIEFLCIIPFIDKC